MRNEIPPALLDPSASGILGMVCGYAPPGMWEQSIAAFQIYVDDSYDEELFVFSGVVATAERWARFSVEWQQRLKEYGIQEFKMSRLSGAYPEYIGYFWRLLEKYIQASICVALPKKHLREISREMGVPQFGDPHFFAFKHFILLAVHEQHRFGNLSHGFDFIFDEQSNIERKVQENWYLFKESLDEQSQAFVGKTPLFPKSIDMPPLQAADLIAWWHRRSRISWGEFREEPMDLPWDQKITIPSIFQDITSDDIRAKCSEVIDRSIKKMVSEGLLVKKNDGDVSSEFGLSLSERLRRYHFCRPQDPRRPA